jgi:5-methyltetrahydrofolate--homocysteine methyltransferase
MKVVNEGKIVIATVEYDIHDIGKNLVASMLSAVGFEIFDLGVNVPPDLICKNIREYKPEIVALSCLLTSTIDSMENTIKKITEEGLRKGVKIIVGGIPLTTELAREIGADSYGHDAHEAVIRCRDLLKGEAQ